MKVTLSSLLISSFSMSWYSGLASASSLPEYIRVPAYIRKTRKFLKDWRSPLQNTRVQSHKWLTHDKEYKIILL